MKAVNSELILRKLEALRNCLHRIKKKKPNNLEVFLHDLDLQDIIVLNLERAVQMSADIASHVLSVLENRSPETMAEGFNALYHNKILNRDLALRMVKAAGFRNTAVHNYQSLNFPIVYSILEKHLSDFDDFALAIHTWLKTSNK